MKEYVKLSQEVIFNGGNAGTIADINSGAIYMFWIGSNPNAANVRANAIVSARMRFVDN